jgi:TolA-binding protein
MRGKASIERRGLRLHGARAATIAAVLACGPVSGCLMTAAQGEELRTAQRASDTRIEQLEESSNQKVAELEQVLERATQVVTRNSADVGAEVQTLREQVSMLEGTTAELRHKLETLLQEYALYKADLEQRLATASTPAGAKPVLDPAEIPADAEGHYKAGTTAYQAAQYEKARALFREFLTRYPQDAKAGNAQYWIGASFLQENKAAAALGELRKVISNFGKSTAVNVSLYGMADAFFRLRACTDAKSAIEALIKRKPDAALLDRAKKLSDDIKLAPKGTCTS